MALFNFNKALLESQIYEESGTGFRFSWSFERKCVDVPTRVDEVRPHKVEIITIGDRTIPNFPSIDMNHHIQRLYTKICPTFSSIYLFLQNRYPESKIKKILYKNDEVYKNANRLVEDYLKDKREMHFHVTLE